MLFYGRDWGAAFAGSPGFDASVCVGARVCVCGCVNGSFSMNLVCIYVASRCVYFAICWSCESHYDRVVSDD